MTESPLKTLRNIDWNGGLDAELRHWKSRGWTVREVAAVLDVSTATAWRWMSQATGRLITEREETNE